MRNTTSKPAWMISPRISAHTGNAKFMVAKRAVEEMTTAQQLADVAISAPHSEVRRLALERLADYSEMDPVYSYVAKYDPDSVLRLVAVERLSNAATLGYVAVNDPYKWIRRTAIEKISDVEILTQVINSDPDPDNRLCALSNINDLNTLVQISRANDHYPVRKKAVMKTLHLKGEEMSQDKQGLRGTVEEIIERITDNNILKDIANNDGDPWVQRVARNRLNGLQVLQ